MKILVPLDLSTVADEAMQPATEIAQALGDELLLVTVLGSRLRNELAEFAAQEHTDVPTLVDTHLRGRAAEVDAVTAGSAVVPGEDAADALVDYADQDDIRMMVIATHGRSGHARWRMGSVAERVVRHSTVPVLVVPMRGRNG